jgi:hypothetical protein
MLAVAPVATSVCITDPAEPEPTSGSRSVGLSLFQPRRLNQEIAMR